VEGLEDCLGTTDIRKLSVDIPTRCQERADLISACLEGQQQAGVGEWVAAGPRSSSTC